MLERLCARWGRDWLRGLILVAAIFVAYQSVWRAGFIWDDDALLTKNPCIVGPLGFKDIWTPGAAVYFPLSISSLWLQHAIWGLNPLPYHLVNIALHAACALLLWRVLRRLNVPGAWLGAALWALHPVQVESVAWVAELKNTQSCLLYLMAIRWFLKWQAGATTAGRKGNEWDYAFALFCAALAILSKTSTVMLPVVLGLIWWWRDGRWHWRNSLRLAPFLLISLIAGGWTIWEQKTYSGALGWEWAQTWPERFIIAALDIWFYLGKLVWPHPLIFVYPRWVADASRPLSFLPVLLLSVCLAVLWWNRGRMQSMFFAAAIFLISLFPVLDFFNAYFFRYSFVEDHLQYLASMGPLALAAAGLTMAFEFLGKRNLFLKPLVCGALLLTIGMLTWRQGRMYADVETLWRTTLDWNPTCWLANNNLGDILLQQKQFDQAIAPIKKAIEIEPGYPEAYNELGNALLQKGRTDEAIAQLQHALAIQPDFAEAHDNLGNVLLQTGRLDEAIIQFQGALAIQPGNAEAHNNLGAALVQKGQANEAIVHLQRALAIQPDFAEAYYNLGNALQKIGRTDEAIGQLQHALAIQPDFAEAHDNLGNVLLQTGRLDEAIIQFQKALAIQPGNIEARYNLGTALFQKGRMDEAILQFQRVLAIQPDNIAAHNNLAAALLQKGQVEATLMHLKRILEIQPDNVAAHNNLGSVLVQNGQWDEAIMQFQKALVIRPDFLEAQNGLADIAWKLATSQNSSLRNGTKAVELARQIEQLSGGKNPSIVAILAAAYAEAGRFSEAITTAERALQMATNQTNTALVAALQTQLKSYRAGIPFRDTGT